MIAQCRAGIAAFDVAAQGLGALPPPTPAWAGGRWRPARACRLMPIPAGCPIARRSWKISSSLRMIGGRSSIPPKNHRKLGASNLRPDSFYGTGPLLLRGRVDVSRNLHGLRHCRRERPTHTSPVPGLRQSGLTSVRPSRLGHGLSDLDTQSTPNVHVRGPLDCHPPCRSKILGRRFSTRGGPPDTDPTSIDPSRRSSPAA